MRDIRLGDWIRYGTRDSSWWICGFVIYCYVTQAGAFAVTIVDERDGEHQDVVFAPGTW